MRVLSDTLTAAQSGRSGISPLAKIVLTYSANTYTYDWRRVATSNTRLLKSTHTEKQWSSPATVVLNDSDLTLTSLDLEGYKAVISYGFTTSEGDEWSATAPLWVVGQQRDSMQGKVICSLSLEGIFDRLGKDKASATYTQEASDTNTAKTLITAIAGATLAPYTHCKAYTVTYDSEDSLIDSFIPADYFRVNLNDSRLSKIQELLGYTTCKARPENDEEIHIFTPTTTGTSYDYEYSLADTYHTFLSKRYRRRVVSPNYIVVQNHPDQGSFTGYAKDSSASLTDMEEREYHYARATSTAQCASLASAILSRYQLQDERGAGILPIMNIGAEVYDYNKVTDARAGDSVTGNVGYITRNVGGNKFGMEFGFGRASTIPLEALAEMATGQATGYVSFDVLQQVIDSIYGNFDEILKVMETQMWTVDSMQAFIDDAHIRKLRVYEQIILPYWPGS